MTAVRPRVVVVGGGFAGLWATRALASAPVEIVLVDRGHHHLFQPLLYQVATTGLSAWCFRPVMHVFFLIGFRNQLMVLLNWWWACWSYQRGARIILGGGLRAAGAGVR